MSRILVSLLKVNTSCSCTNLIVLNRVIVLVLRIMDTCTECGKGHRHADKSNYPTIISVVPFDMAIHFLYSFNDTGQKRLSYY